MSIPQIAVWGASGVGKTVYLAGAMLALQTFYEDRWSWLIGGNSAGREHTFDFINYEIGKLQGGRMVQPTEEKEPEQYLFQLEQRGDLLGRTGRYHEIALVDVAGVLIEDTADRYSYFETLRNSQGILMLIDPKLKGVYQAPTPERSEVTYFALINLLIKHLQDTHGKGARLEMPIAICLTKIDQEEHWPYRNQPKKYLQEILGKATFNLLANTFTKKEFFAISTVGRYRDPVTGQEQSNLDPHPDRNHLLNFKAWEPYCVLDPLFWLLDHFEREHDRRLPLWRRVIRQAVRESNYKK